MLPKWGTHSGATFLRNLFSFKNENRIEISISELETDDSKQFTWSLQTIPLVAFVLWRFWGYYTWLVRSPLAGAAPNLIRNTSGPAKAGTEAPHFRIQKTSLRLFFSKYSICGIALHQTNWKLDPALGFTAASSQGHKTAVLFPSITWPCPTHQHACPKFGAPLRQRSWFVIRISFVKMVIYRHFEKQKYSMPLFKGQDFSELFINTNTAGTVSNFWQKDTIAIHHRIQEENHCSVGSSSKRMGFCCSISSQSKRCFRLVKSNCKM